LPRSVAATRSISSTCAAGVGTDSCPSAGNVRTYSFVSPRIFATCTSVIRPASRSVRSAVFMTFGDTSHSTDSRAIPVYRPVPSLLARVARQ
jgi:hypothetical protein